VKQKRKQNGKKSTMDLERKQGKQKRKQSGGEE
jgi:hypothetical protein